MPFEKMSTKRDKKRQKKELTHKFESALFVDINLKYLNQIYENILCII